MKFKMRVHNNKDGKEWDEEYNKPDAIDQASAEAVAQKLIDYFNSTLRPYESPRTLVSVTLGDGNASLPHEWHKTNLTTIMERGRQFDTAACSTCGITGKRYGLGDVTRDPEYKAKGYSSCDTAQVLLARRDSRREKVQ